MEEKTVKDVTYVLGILQKYRVWVGRVQKALAELKKHPRRRMK